jgi:hypothetical protein
VTASLAANTTYYYLCPWLECPRRLGLVAGKSVTTSASGCTVSRTLTVQNTSTATLSSGHDGDLRHPCGGFFCHHAGRKCSVCPVRAEQIN